jgi:hypothetical protein
MTRGAAAALEVLREPGEEDVTKRLRGGSAA